VQEGDFPERQIHPPDDSSRKEMKDCGHIYRLYTGSLCTTQTSRQDHGIIPGHLHFPYRSVAQLSGQAFH
jgi:hypothetical protein